MKIKALSIRIKKRKMLLNFLLKYFSPTNFLMVKLSQNLDTHIAYYQHYLSRRHNNRRTKPKEERRLVA